MNEYGKSYFEVTECSRNHDLPVTQNKMDGWMDNLTQLENYLNLELKRHKYRRRKGGSLAYLEYKKKTYNDKSH